MASKSEARMSKSETSTKFKARMTETLTPGDGPVLNFGFRLLEFVSDFGIRISSFQMLAVLAVGLFFAPIARAQPNPPRVGYVYPAGGRQGDTFKIRVGGQFLSAVTGAYVSGGGIQATVLEYDRPLTQPQINALNKKLQELQKQGRAPAVLKEIAGIREQIAASRKRSASPVLSEFVTLEVTVASDAQVGDRQLRLAAVAGLSNPLVFCVGQLPEFTESEPNDGVTDAEMNITLPATVNGRMLPGVASQPQLSDRPDQPFTPGDVDRYRFQAHKGQQLVIAVSARQLMPYLADAVPGWFQATLTLYDAKGRELAYDDDYRFHPDPVIHYEVPEDGEYVIEIKDALYRGRDDFVYRIEVGEIPFVTSIFPLGGRVGERTDVELVGWNLPVDRLTMDANDKGPGVYPLSVRKGDLISNNVPFAVDTLPECLEKEPDNSPQEAQQVTLPIIVNGRIDQPGDWDVFSFNGRGGEEVIAETIARRLDSPLDSVLRLTDAAGRQLAYNDDHEDKGSGLITHHADSLIAATLPADGTYYVYLGDVQHKGGQEYAYRLRISSPRPDFDLRVVPSGISARAGQTIPITVYALRKDGFSGEITLALKDAPPGFALKGILVQPREDKLQLTLTAPPNPLAEPVSLSLEGRAVIGGQSIVHLAVPADDMMQAFAYRHLVPARDLKVLVADRRAGQPPRTLTPQPLKIPAGGTARLQVEMLSLRFFEKVQFELSEPPDGIVLQEVSIGPQTAEITLQCDAAKIKPGTKGNLIVNISGERTPPAANQPVPLMRRRIALGSLQAMPFEVVEP